MFDQVKWEAPVVTLPFIGQRQPQQWRILCNFPMPPCKFE